VSAGRLRFGEQLRRPSSLESRRAMLSPVGIAAEYGPGACLPQAGRPAIGIASRSLPDQRRRLRR